MKLKIYLRGLGIGIVVTALILGISGGQKEMSDAEVIARAKQLGMVEAETETGKLSDNYGAEKIETEKNNTEESRTNESEQVAETEAETTAVEQEAEEETTAVEQETEEEASKAPELKEETQDVTEKETVEEIQNPAQTIEVTIVSGDDSAAASRRIYEAGLVESAADLDKYLCSNGYSKKVVSGTYKIPVGSDNETIAKIITKNR